MKVNLEVKNLTKTFGSRTAVNNVSFEVFEGEIFGFLGPNGAGKTTVLRMVCGLAAPTSGDAIICGHSIKKEFEKAIINVGGIIENPEMYKNFSGLENLKYYASLYKDIDKDRINQVVELVGLKDRMKDKIKTYSLGMKQRIGIAQALLHRPKLLILDEPTNGLDPSGVIDMRKFLTKLAKAEGISILISSHGLAEMELICDTIGIIDRGVLVSIRSVADMTKGGAPRIQITVNFPNYAGKLLFEKYETLDSITLEDNTLTVGLPIEEVPEITNYLVKKGLRIYSITSTVKTLEEAFLETIENERLSFGNQDRLTYQTTTTTTTTTGTTR
ncbi:MAG: ABC transporter ATP-binding protein [Christensenellaceae bacterium]|jgi:ABC-2 type transport system ATP-binding protein|nr:ABC transporter ATP-binding protein [Christensenellaceae bacterium]